MKICVMGLGSIGMRHVRNLLAMGENDLLGYDLRVGESGFACEPIQGTNSLDLVWKWKPEAVLICTPPETHNNLLMASYFYGAAAFCEKPLVTNAVDAMNRTRVIQKGQHILAVGYQLRYQLDDIPVGINLTWECSQDMSLWPSQYTKDVLLEFSHEIDAACYINGPVEAVWASNGPYGWVLKLRHFECVNTILINPQARDLARSCFSSSGAVWQFDQAKNEQAYKDELVSFLAVCNGAPWDDRLCTGQQAAHVIRIIEACKQSARNYEVVRL